MPDFIATYDLVDTTPSPYAEFTKQANARGWSSTIQSDAGKLYRLPNTTLIGTFVNRNAALNQLREAGSAASRAIGRAVIMPKWIVAERGASQFDSNEYC